MRRMITLAALAAMIGLGGLARRSEAQFAVTFGNPYTGQGVTIGNGVNSGYGYGGYGSSYGYASPYGYATPYGYTTPYSTGTVYSSGYRGVVPSYGYSGYTTYPSYYAGRRGVLIPRSGWAPYRRW